MLNFLDHLFILFRSIPIFHKSAHSWSTLKCQPEIISKIASTNFYHTNLLFPPPIICQQNPLKSDDAMMLAQHRFGGAALSSDEEADLPLELRRRKKTSRKGGGDDDEDPSFSGLCVLTVSHH